MKGCSRKQVLCLMMWLQLSSTSSLHSQDSSPTGSHSFTLSSLWFTAVHRCVGPKGKQQQQQEEQQEPKPYNMVYSGYPEHHKTGFRDHYQNSSSAWMLQKYISSCNQLVITHSPDVTKVSSSCNQLLLTPRRGFQCK